MNNKFSTERIPIILYFLNLKPQNGNFNFLLNITVKIIVKKHNESNATCYSLSFFIVKTDFRLKKTSCQLNQ
jgi:hypothetical protein